MTATFLRQTCQMSCSSPEASTGKKSVVGVFMTLMHSCSNLFFVISISFALFCLGFVLESCHHLPHQCELPGRDQQGFFMVSLLFLASITGNRNWRCFQKIHDGVKRSSVPWPDFVQLCLLRFWPSVALKEVNCATISFHSKPRDWPVKS